MGLRRGFNSAMARASALFDKINGRLEGINVERFEHGSNIFPLKLESGVDSKRFVKILKEHSVIVSPPDADHSRRIMLTVNPTLLRQDIQDLFFAFEHAIKESLY